MTFLQQVLIKILEKSPDNWHKTYWIVPSIRVGRYLLQHLSEHHQHTFFAPKICTFPEFIQVFAPEKSVAERLDIFLLLYQIHQEIEENQKSFDAFYPWAELLYQDFNTIDQALVNAQDLFKNLKNYQELEHFLEEDWSFAAENWTSRQTQIADFWDKIPIYYQKLQQKMQEKQCYYNGALLRELAENPTIYEEKIKHIDFFYFIGFAAFTQAERKIIALLHQYQKVHCFFQTDIYFLNQPAGQFFLNNEDLGAVRIIEKKMQNDVKKITMIATTSQTAQVAQVKKIIQDLEAENGTKALVLSEENLVSLLMHDLPEQTNIAPGLAISNSQSYFLIQKFFTEINFSFISFDFLDIILQHPLITPFLDFDKIFLWKKRPQPEIFEYDILKNLIKEDENSKLFLSYFNVLWIDQKNDKKIENMIILINFLGQKTKIIHEQEALFIIEQKLQMIYNKILKIYEKIINLKTYFLLLQQALQNQKFDFQGTIFSGLQVMGFLETRALDFDHLLITSLEEGVFPTTKQNDSLIPYTLKKYYQIPTYQKAEALSAYYFYRLLIHAKNIYFLYSNSQTEPSRFVRQVEEEWAYQNPYIQIVKQNAENYLPVFTTKYLQTDEIIQENLKNYFAKGLSASAFCTLLRCPQQFYFHHVLGCRKKEDNAIDLQQNIMGEWVHQALKEIYTPILKEKDVKKVKEVLKNANHLKSIRSQIDRLIQEKWKINFETMYSGKNALFLEVTMALIQKWLNYALKQLEKENHFYPIWALEDYLTYPIETHFGTLSLVGQIDCVQKALNFDQIIDYKTAFIRPENIRWNFEKPFFEQKDLHQPCEISAYTVQLLWYSLLYQKNYPKQNLHAGVYSLQNLEVGLLQIDPKNPHLSEEILTNFEIQVVQKLEQLFNRNFIWQHTNDLYCDFC